MLDKEKIIKEERVAKAVDRNYMGLDGKFGIILKQLGKPVLFQGSSDYEITPWRDVYDLDISKDIPEADEEMPIKEIGKIFDGLKFGYHIEISYLKDGSIPVKKPIMGFPDMYTTIYEEASKVLKVSWKGYLVYLEAEGDLHLFTPSPEWEDVIQKIYESANKLRNQHRMDKMLEDQQENKKEKLSFLERLKDKWGI